MICCFITTTEISSYSIPLYQHYPPLISGRTSFTGTARRGQKLCNAPKRTIVEFNNRLSKASEFLSGRALSYTLFSKFVIHTFKTSKLSLFLVTLWKFFRNYSLRLHVPLKIRPFKYKYSQVFVCLKVSKSFKVTKRWKESFSFHGVACKQSFLWFNFILQGHLQILSP